MKINKKEPKVISHIDLSKKKIASLAMGTTDFEIKEFSKLTKQEKKRNLRHIYRIKAKICLYHKQYFMYIYLMLKSIF